MNPLPNMDEFLKKFFVMKPKPYQKNLIKLITDGKTKRLKIMPYRPHASIKHTDFMAKLVEEHKKVIDDSYLDAVRNGISTLEFNPMHRPSLIIIDDPLCPRDTKEPKCDQ